MASLAAGVMVMHAGRIAAVFVFVALSAPAQNLSVLYSLDVAAPSPGTMYIATDSTGVYMINLSGSRLVLHKLDRSGNELWTSHSDEAHWLTAMIAVTSSGIYVTGSVDGVAPGQTGAGGWDTYLARYDTDGNRLWIRQFGTSGDEEGGAVAADVSGVYVTSASWIFAQQNYVASLRKYSPDGDLLWTRDLTGVAFWSLPLAAARRQPVSGCRDWAGRKGLV